jgi:hypothetical protein
VRCAITSGDWEKAGENLKRAIAAEPEFVGGLSLLVTVNPYVELAVAHFKLGEIDAGVAEIREPLVVQPDHPMSLAMMVRHAINEGDQAAARASGEMISRWCRRVSGRFGEAPE